MNAPRYLAGLTREELPDTFNELRWCQDDLREEWEASVQPQEPEPAPQAIRTVGEPQVVRDMRALMSDGRERNANDVRARLGDMHANTINAAMARIGARPDWIRGPRGNNIRTWRLP